MLSVKEVNDLLSILCIKHGYCLPPNDCERFRENPPTTILDFTDAVFLAEGLDPLLVPRSGYKAIKNEVAKFFERNYNDELDEQFY